MGKQEILLANAGLALDGDVIGVDEPEVCQHTVAEVRRHEDGWEIIDRRGVDLGYWGPDETLWVYRNVTVPQQPAPRVEVHLLGRNSNTVACDQDVTLEMLVTQDIADVTCASCQEKCDGWAQAIQAAMEPRTVPQEEPTNTLALWDAQRADESVRACLYSRPGNCMNLACVYHMGDDWHPGSAAYVERLQVEALCQQITDSVAEGKMASLLEATRLLVQRVTGLEVTTIVAGELPTH